MKIPYLVHFFELILLLVMLKGKNTQSIQVSRTTSAALSLIRNHAHYFELETGCVISCSCRRLVAKKFPALGTNWLLGNFPATEASSLFSRASHLSCDLFYPLISPRYQRTSDLEYTSTLAVIKLICVNLFVLFVLRYLQ